MNRFTLSLAPVDIALGLYAHAAVALTGLVGRLFDRQFATAR